MRQIVLDTETTGLQSDDRIIEFGCIELINRKLTGKKYHQYINPQKIIDHEAMAVHGITNQFLETKPLFANIADEFLAFIGDSELIIHNAPFDVGFINYELRLLHKKIKPINETHRIIDTLALARQLHIGQRNSLDALCKRYRIDNSGRELHGALLDANLLAQVYLAMTGGQSCLFDIIQSVDNPIVNETHREAMILKNNSRKLCIIKADTNELKLHQAQLNKINEKNKCVWLDI